MSCHVLSLLNDRERCFKRGSGGSDGIGTGPRDSTVLEVSTRRCNLGYESIAYTPGTLSLVPFVTHDE